jgi:hypothetical protein
VKLVKYYAFILIVLTASLVACKKDSSEPVNLGGTIWSDSAVINTVVFKPFTLAFKNDGTMNVTFGPNYTFPGTWNKLPNSNVVYFYFDEDATNKWKGETTLNGNKMVGGTLTRTAPSAATGTFTATKQ